MNPMSTLHHKTVPTSINGVNRTEAINICELQLGITTLKLQRGSLNTWGQPHLETLA